MLAEDQQFALSGWIVAPDEAWLALIAAGIGIAAALLPAVRAYRTDIATTLAH
jgi:putative ABC transport system permease protein